MTEGARQPPGDESAEYAPTPVHIDVRDLHFVRSGRSIFEGLSCGFPRGKLSVIAGASGAGKTTLLRMLARLLRPTRGEIWIDWEVDLTAMSEADVRTYRGEVGMLFQRGALLDSMSVYENVALPLRERTTLPEDRIRTEVERAFSAVDLHDVGDLLPGELSGGMVKRAGLARALIQRPKILLCDEPFSGLDPPTVRKVETLLQQVRRSSGATMILTSHHTHSTRRIADHLVMLNGKRALEGTPDALIAADEWVKDFFLEPERSEST